MHTLGGMERRAASMMECSTSRSAVANPVVARRGRGPAERRRLCVAAPVITPARVESIGTAPRPQLNIVEPSAVSLKTPVAVSTADLLTHIVEPVKSDVALMNANLKNVVGNRHPMLMAAAEQIFGAGGKKLRPVIVFLVARATAQLMGLR
jgi:all-trans-nonaprenyl-diphosphate synthase